MHCDDILGECIVLWDADSAPSNHCNNNHESGLGHRFLFVGQISKKKEVVAVDSFVYAKREWVCCLSMIKYARHVCAWVYVTKGIFGQFIVCDLFFPQSVNISAIIKCCAGEIGWTEREAVGWCVDVQRKWLEFQNSQTISKLCHFMFVQWGCSFGISVGVTCSAGVHM